jgi:hypothetical protein
MTVRNERKPVCRAETEKPRAGQLPNEDIVFVCRQFLIILALFL